MAFSPQRLEEFQSRQCIVPLNKTLAFGQNSRNAKSQKIIVT